MFAPSQEENTNPNETRFVSHSDVSLAYTLTVIRRLNSECRLRGVGMIQAAREDVNRLLRQWGYITQLLLFAAAADSFARSTRRAHGSRLLLV